MFEFNGDIFAISTAFTWGLAVIMFRLAGSHAKTIPLKVFQNTLATLLFFLALPFFQQTWYPDLTSLEWVLVTLSAFLGITLGDTFYLNAINRLGASSIAFIDCLYSPCVVVFAYFMFGESISLTATIGGSFILLSILVGSSPDKSITLDKQDIQWGLIYGILSQVCMAATVILVRDILRKDSVLAITAYRFLIGNLILMGYFYFTPKRSEMWDAFKNHHSMIWRVGGTILGPFLATLLWFSSFKYTLAGRAAVYNQLSTIFIIIFAAFFLKEKFTVRKAIAILLAVAGGYIVSTSNPL